MNQKALCQMTFAALLMLVSLASLAAQQPGQPPQQPPPPMPKKMLPLPPFADFSDTPETIKILQDMMLDMKEFQVPLKLSEALGLLNEKIQSRGPAASIFVDMEAFRAEMKKEPSLPLIPGPTKEKTKLMDTPIHYPPFPKKMSVGTALKWTLSQIPNYDATFLIQRGNIVITTKTKATVKALLKVKVAATFHQKPLVEAIYKLSDQTGASIVIDPRVGEKFLVPVTATFANDTTLESALTLLTDTVGLRMVIVGDGIYITTPENGDQLRYMPTKY